MTPVQVGREDLEVPRLGGDHRRIGILEDLIELDTAILELGDDRHRAEFEEREEHDQMIDGVLEEQRNRGVLAHPFGPEPCGELADAGAVVCCRYRAGLFAGLKLANDRMLSPRREPLGCNRGNPESLVGATHRSGFSPVTMIACGGVPSERCTVMPVNPVCSSIAASSSPV